MKITRIAKEFLSDERGTETVEWAIMVGIIAVAAIASIVAIGGWVSTKFGQLEDALAANP